jgi:hypothetical protein
MGRNVEVLGLEECHHFVDGVVGEEQGSDHRLLRFT